MVTVVWLFALLTALIHIVVFAWEAFLLQRPFVHEKVFSIPVTDVPALRLWAFGLGFYNLFWALGLVIGVVMWMLGDVTPGRTLVIYVCVVLVLSGGVLFIADRAGLGRVRGANIGGAISQSVPPLIALLALALS
jgi:putative membrane protein